eukprot:3033312-Prymnesium_polylepis.1
MPPAEHGNVPCPTWQWALQIGQWALPNRAICPPKYGNMLPKKGMGPPNLAMCPPKSGNVLREYGNVLRQIWQRALCCAGARSRLQQKLSQLQSELLSNCRRAPLPS